MKLVVIGSSSKGNGYALISTSNEILLLEAGVRAKKMLKAIDYATTDIVGCLATHRHLDHVGHLKEYTAYGFPIAANEDVFSAKQVPEHLKHVLEDRKTYHFGSFGVCPFRVKHDVPTFGYLIHHPECGTILFATDCAFIPYRFPNVKHLIIEANYSDEILGQRILSGEENAARRKRLLETHMEIGITIKGIKKCDPYGIKTITLIHLSSQNGNAKEFQRLVAKSFGIPTYVAKPNLIVNLEK